MATVITTVPDVVNLALAGIGRKDRIASIFEGSTAAKIALDLYSETRDDMLRVEDYGFSERNMNLVLLKSAPPNGYFPPNLWDGTTNPAVPWLFSYAYPDDCIKVRAIKPQPTFVINFTPQPVVFRIENDNYYTPARKVILCNVEFAMMTYTGQVTNPSTWEPAFVAAFADELGRKMAQAFANMEAAKMEAALGVRSTQDAVRTEG